MHRRASSAILTIVCVLTACVDDFVDIGDGSDETGTGDESGGETGDEDAEAYACEPAIPFESVPPVTGWQADLASNNQDEVGDLAVTADGSVIVVGWYAPIDSYEYDAFATKLGPNGEEQWSLIWSSPSQPTTNNGVEITADGTILIVGSSGSGLTLTGLTPDGDELWRHTWTGTQNPGRGRGLALGPSGQIYVAAVKDNIPARVARVTEDGETEWQTGFSWSDTQSLNALAASCDGSVYTVGGYVDRDYWMDDGEGVVAKLDEDGNIEWQVASTVHGVDEYVDLALVSDTVFAVGNSMAHSPSEYTGASFVSRIDPAGELVWTEYVDVPESMGAITTLGDGVVVGHEPNNLVHFSADGEIVWTDTIASLDGRNLALALGPDASLLVAGSRSDGGDRDIAVRRLDQP